MVATASCALLGECFRVVDREDVQCGHPVQEVLLRVADQRGGQLVERGALERRLGQQVHLPAQRLFGLPGGTELGLLGLEVVLCAQVLFVELLGLAGQPL